MLPCEKQSQGYSPRDKVRYQAVLRQADGVRYISRSYYRGCMLARNRAMVDASQLCLCYLTHSGGGTAYTVAAALRQGLPVINLAEELPLSDT